MAGKSAWVAVMVLACAASVTRAQPGSRDGDKMRDTSVQTSAGALKYLLFVPKDYSPAQRYPLVVSLHGLGDASSEYISSTNGFDQAHPWIEDSIQARVPHFIMVPQCNAGTWGGMMVGGGGGSTNTLSPAAKSVLEGIEGLKRRYSLDTNRFIITGFSIGGAGTYHQIQMKPDYWAAAIPCAAGGDSSKIDIHARTPIWHHQGLNDGGGAAAIRMYTALDNHRHATVKVTSRFTINSASGWRTAVQNGTRPEDIIYREARPAYDSVRKAVEAGAPYIYLMLTGGDHSAGWMSAAHNPLLAKWAFSKVRGMLTAPLAVPRAGTPARRNGARLSFGGAGAAGRGLFNLTGRRMAPGGGALAAPFGERAPILRDGGPAR